MGECKMAFFQRANGVGEMRVKSQFIRSLALSVCAFVWMPAIAAAQEAGPGGSAEAKVIGDHILVPVTLSTEAFRKETHLVLDYAATTPLHIYGQIFGAVRFGENEQTLKILGAEGTAAGGAQGGRAADRAGIAGNDAAVAPGQPLFPRAQGD